jgi:hypothetical protein
MEGTKKPGCRGRAGFRLWVLAFIVPLAGCAGAPRAVNGGGPFEFEVIIEEQAAPLLPGGEDGHRLLFRFELADIVQDTPGPLGANLLRDLVYGGLSPRDYAAEIIASRTGDYQAQGRALDGEAVPGAVMNWEYTEKVEILPSGSRFLVISRSREYYLGGAHGMREKRFFTIDLERRGAIRLADLIRPDALPALREALAGALRSYAGLEAGAPLSGGGFFEDGVEAPENFFPAARGLGFQWDPYEIAPYVMGPIQVILPWEQVRDLLSPAYRVRPAGGKGLP